MSNHDRPWMTALEMQFGALKLSREYLRDTSNTTSALRRMEIGAVEVLPRAQPFAWSADTVRAVWAASQTVPNDARLEHSNQGPEWWWLEWPLPIPMRTSELYGSIAGLLFEWITPPSDMPDRKPILAVTEFRASETGLPFMMGFTSIPEGSALSELISGRSYNPDTGSEALMSPSSLALHRFILAAKTWLGQRVVVSVSGHIERHRRKQIAREHDAHVSDVKIIQLRRAESRPHEHDPNGDPVEWSCRWIVNGHWRNQYHQSNGKHELKYILPYVKGPADKPLKVPGKQVYLVNR